MKKRPVSVLMIAAMLLTTFLSLPITASAGTPAQTVAIEQLGSANSAFQYGNVGGYIEYPLNAVGLDLDASGTVRPAPTNSTILAATVSPSDADAAIEWTATDITGTNVVTLGAPAVNPKYSIMVDNASGNNTLLDKIFNSSVTVTANSAGVAVVTARETGTNVTARYIVTVSDQSTTYYECEANSTTPNYNQDNTYIVYSGSQGADKNYTTAGAAGTSNNALAGGLTNTKLLRMKVSVPSSGSYNISVFYSTSTVRNTKARVMDVGIVNSTDTVQSASPSVFVCQGSDSQYDFPETVPLTATMNLAAGTNYLMLGGDSKPTGYGNAPNADKIGIAAVPSFGITAITNITAVSGTTINLKSTVAAGSVSSLNTARGGSYQILRDGSPVGQAISATEYDPKVAAPKYLTYEYDTGNSNIIPAGQSLLTRDYSASVDSSAYTAAGTYTAVFTATGGTASAPVTLFEVAAATHTITASAGANGAISTAGAISVNDGADQTFTITPDTGYQIDIVTVDGGPVTVSGNTYTFTNVTGDHTIDVSFKQIPAPITHTITATATTNGAISPAGAVSVNEGADQTFTITPDTGYQLDTVSVDGSPVTVSGNTYKFANVTGDHTIDVSFKQIPATVTHTITASTGTNGAISPIGTVSVNEGADQTFTITPDTGYQIDTVTVDGSPVTVSGNTYTFANVTGDHTIDVSFTVVPVVMYNVTGSDFTLENGFYVTTVTVDRGTATGLTHPKLLVVGNNVGGGQSCWTIDLTGMTDTKSEQIAVSNMTGITVYLLDGDIDWLGAFSGVKAAPLKLLVP